MRRTKIICTLGPATSELETIKQLLIEGMNVARFNFSHGNHAEHAERMRLVREASRDTGIPVALLLDTKGPEIRTGPVRGGASIELRKGSRLRVEAGEGECSSDLLYVSYALMIEQLCAGTHIFIADGLIDLEVLGREGNGLECLVVAGGVIGGRKNVNVPGLRVQLPAVTESDRKDIAFGLAQGIDFVAASFIRCAADVVQVQKLVEAAVPRPAVIAKIENQEGVENLDEIIRVADGVLVARGDLGVQLPGETVPLIQKRIIEACNRRNKPAVTATQMLESMTVNPKPTRAELSDVANAIFDGTDAVMLSGETAGGAYPVEAVKTMHRVALAVESSPEYRERSRRLFSIQATSTDIAHAVAKASCVTAADIRAAIILSPTLTGNTARLLSLYRPEQPIIAATPRDDVLRKLLLIWGVHPLKTPEVDDSDEMIVNGLKAALATGYVKRFERAVVTAGVPIHSPIMTNTARVYFLGTVLNKAERGYGGEVTGRIVRVEDAAQAAAKLMLSGDEILLTRHMDESFLPFMPGIAGYILEEYSILSWERLSEKNQALVGLASVKGAWNQFSDNQTVTINGEERIVYDGIA